MDRETRLPPDFRYPEVYRRGKPQHSETDFFSFRHPPMDRGHRAKIFAPFDALKGHREAIAATEELYIDRPEPGEDEKEEIGRRLKLLHDLTCGSRAAGENSVRVTVRFFVPCADGNDAASSGRGRRESVTGICRRVDGTVSHSLTVDQKVIRFEDLLFIELEREEF